MISGESIVQQIVVVHYRVWGAMVGGGHVPGTALAVMIPNQAAASPVSSTNTSAMPPRKKAKAQEKGEAAQSQDKSSPAYDPLRDPWTYDQETQLFKSMMKWKPTGMHKHFRMISIHNDMRSLGYAPEDAHHTRIPGVWEKLNQLYDLHALDERENSFAFHDMPDPFDPDEADDVPEFELAEEDFGELMWQKRFHGPESAVSSSPPYIPIEEDKALYRPGIGLLRDLPEGSKLHRAESPSPATRTTPKATKNTRASRSTAKKGKGGKAGQAAKNSKAQSTVSASESSEEEEEEDADEEEESSAESEAEPAQAAAPSTRRTNRSAPKAKPAPKRTRKR